MKYLVAITIFLIGLSWYIIERIWKIILIILVMAWYFDYKKERNEIFHTVIVPIPFSKGDSIEWESTRDYFSDLFSLF